MLPLSTSTSTVQVPLSSQRSEFGTPAGVMKPPVVGLPGLTPETVTPASVPVPALSSLLKALNGERSEFVSFWT